MIRVITQPIDPLFLPDMQAHLRVDAGADEALLLQEYSRAAMAYVQAFTRRAVTTQTLELVLDSFPSGPIPVPLPPLQSIESVSYVDPDGATQTWDSYTVDVDSIYPDYGECYPDTRDVPSAVTVRFIAGYDPTTIPSEIPAAIRAALLLLVADLYENRESQQPARLYPNKTVDSLLWPYRSFQ